jgi:hypothetical protein
MLSITTDLVVKTLSALLLNNDRNLGPHLRTPNPLHLLYKSGDGVNPGLNPGFGVLNSISGASEDPDKNIS